MLGDDLLKGEGRMRSAKFQPNRIVRRVALSDGLCGWWIAAAADLCTCMPHFQKIFHLQRLKVLFWAQEGPKAKTGCTCQGAVP